MKKARHRCRASSGSVASVAVLFLEPGLHRVGEVGADGAKLLPGLHQDEVDAVELGALLVGEVGSCDAGLHAVEGGLLEGVDGVGEHGVVGAGAHEEEVREGL